MALIFNICIYLYLWSGVLCTQEMPWLPCQFHDEHVFQNSEGHTETKLIHKEAMLQFGQKGDAPVNPHAVTFLVTGSKLDLRRFVEGVDPDQLECELRRYSTHGIHVRWPVQGAQEYNRWFSCSIKHSKGLFTISSFLRLPTDQPSTGEPDYRNWAVIGDRDILTTTVVMVMKTLTPTVIARLSSQQKLHCQFALDHKGANMTVEWHWQHRGERVKLFSHSRSGKSEGTGVVLKGLANGDASYTLPMSKMSSEGTYICSVSVNPLFGSQDINLHIEEPPRVTVDIGPTLLLKEGEDKRVTCEAESYYPLDVEIVWYEQEAAASGQRVGAPLPKPLNNILMSSHKHNNDKTYSVSAFFYLQADTRDSGKQFTCSVSHKALRMPIKKSFTLIVEEPSSWLFNFTVGVTLVSLIVLLFIMLRYLHSVRKKAVHKKPY